MNELLDGTNVPWYAVFGKREPTMAELRRATPPPRQTMAERAAHARTTAGAIERLGVAAQALANALAESLRRFK